MFKGSDCIWVHFEISFEKNPKFFGFWSAHPYSVFRTSAPEKLTAQIWKNAHLTWYSRQKMKLEFYHSKFDRISKYWIRIRRSKSELFKKQKSRNLYRVPCTGRNYFNTDFYLAHIMSRAHHAEYHCDDVIILAENEYHWLIRQKISADLKIS